jgi:hypothetical protein
MLDDADKLARGVGKNSQQRAASRGQRAESIEHRAESREQRAEGRGQRAEEKDKQGCAKLTGGPR